MILVLAVVAACSAAEAAGNSRQTPPEAEKLEALLVDALIKNGRMTHNTKDESGQYWYKVVYYYGEMLTGMYKKAYISGKFINVRNISEDEKSVLRFRLDRDY